jgi:diadenosine tetraphosphate (Ap4A) HIT family hydrolase
MTCNLCDEKQVLLYEDEHIVISHAGETSRGHTRVFTKKHVDHVEDIPDDIFEHLFFSGSYAAAILFELLSAHGTNIILREKDHARIEVIERKQDDGLNFQWKPKTLSAADMDDSQKKIKDAFMIGGEKKEDRPVEIDVKPEVVKGVDNYRIKNLDRIP